MAVRAFWLTRHVLYYQLVHVQQYSCTHEHCMSTLPSPHYLPHTPVRYITNRFIFFLLPPIHRLYEGRLHLTVIKAGSMQPVQWCPIPLPLPRPRAETPQALITMAFHVSTDEAAKRAVLDMLDWLKVRGRRGRVSMREGWFGLETEPTGA